MACDPIESFFVEDPSRLIGEVYRLMRVTGRLSALIQKGEAPEGMGANYQTLLWERSGNPDASVWTDVQPNSLTADPSTCNPAPDDVNPANTVYNYGLQQTLTRSNKLCMQDVRLAWQYQDQIMGIRDNFKADIVDKWEIRDKKKYFEIAGHKIVCNAALTDYQNQTDFGTALPTSRLTAGILRNVYEQLSRDAAGEEPVAMVRGAAQFILLTSPESQEDVIQQDPAVRQDIRYAQMGEDTDAWLLNTWNVDRAFAGFLFTIDLKMPRFDFDFGNARYVERPYYRSVPATNGDKLVVNPAYQTAAYEDSYVFVKQAVRRDMPRPFGTGGSDASFNPVNFNGDIVWRNILNEECNPLGLIGRYYAPMMAAYKPIKPQFGYILRHLRCSSYYLSSCY